MIGRLGRGLLTSRPAHPLLQSQKPYEVLAGRALLQSQYSTKKKNSDAILFSQFSEILLK